MNGSTKNNYRAPAPAPWGGIIPKRIWCWSFGSGWSIHICIEGFKNTTRWPFIHEKSSWFISYTKNDWLINFYDGDELYHAVWYPVFNAMHTHSHTHTLAHKQGEDSCRQTRDIASVPYMAVEGGTLSSAAYQCSLQLLLIGISLRILIKCSIVFLPRLFVCLFVRSMLDALESQS